MATLREYFETDATTPTVTETYDERNVLGLVVGIVRARLHQDFGANAKYLSFYFSDTDEVLQRIAAVLDSPNTADGQLPGGSPGALALGTAGYSEHLSAATMTFTGRVFMYIDKILSPEIRAEIVHRGQKNGLHVIVRDAESASLRSKTEKPLAFVSHDSSDKESLVRSLVAELTQHMCPVWYDEYSLQVGDSLRESIERGLRETKKCIVIVSPNFIANNGWAKAEFDSVYTREILERGNVMLPIWHNVTAKQVYDYSPRLANKFALNSSVGPKELARILSAVVKNDIDVRTS